MNRAFLLSLISYISLCLFLIFNIIALFPHLWGYLSGALLFVVLLGIAWKNRKTLVQELHTPFFRSTLWLNAAFCAAGIYFYFIKYPHYSLIALPLFIACIADSVYLWSYYCRQSHSLTHILRKECRIPLGLLLVLVGNAIFSFFQS